MYWNIDVQSRISTIKYRQIRTCVRNSKHEQLQSLSLFVWTNDMLTTIIDRANRYPIYIAMKLGIRNLSVEFDEMSSNGNVNLMCVYDIECMASVSCNFTIT